MVLSFLISNRCTGLKGRFAVWVPLILGRFMCFVGRLKFVGAVTWLSEERMSDLALGVSACLPDEANKCEHIALSVSSTRRRFHLSDNISSTCECFVTREEKLFARILRVIFVGRLVTAGLVFSITWFVRFVFSNAFQPMKDCHEIGLTFCCTGCLDFRLHSTHWGRCLFLSFVLYVMYSPSSIFLLQARHILKFSGRRILSQASCWSRV